MVQKCFMRSWTWCFRHGVPAAPGGGQKHVLQRRVGPAQRADPQLSGEERAQERLAQILGGLTVVSATVRKPSASGSPCAATESRVDAAPGGRGSRRVARQPPCRRLLPRISLRRSAGVPWATIRPWLMIRTRSQVTSISGRMWLEMMTVIRPRRLAIRSRTIRIWWGSRPIVGSSMMMTGGSARIGLGDPDPLAVALGEPADDLVADPLQVAELEHLVDPGAELSPGNLLQPAPEIEVFAHPHVLGQGVVLGHVADPALDLVGCGRHGESADRHLARGGGKVAGQDPHGRGFSRAVGPRKPMISPAAP